MDDRQFAAMYVEIFQHRRSAKVLDRFLQENAKLLRILTTTIDVLESEGYVQTAKELRTALQQSEGSATE